MSTKGTPRGMQRRQRTIYLPEALDRRLRIRAAQLDTTVSVIMAQALRAYFTLETGGKTKKKGGKRA